jgi:hypothetical protein
VTVVDDLLWGIPPTRNKTPKSCFPYHLPCSVQNLHSTPASAVVVVTNSQVDHQDVQSSRGFIVRCLRESNLNGILFASHRRLSTAFKARFYFGRTNVASAVNTTNFILHQLLYCAMVMFVSDHRQTPPHMAQPPHWQGEDDVVMFIFVLQVRRNSFALVIVLHLKALCEKKSEP